MDRGITDLITINNNNFLHLRYGSYWKNSECIDFENERVTSFWKSVQSEENYIDKWLRSNSNSLSLFETIQFKVNKNLIKSKDLFGIDKIFTIFRKDKSRNLLVLRSKSVKEITKSQYTKEGESYIPLAITYLNSKFSICNCI